MSEKSYLIEFSGTAADLQYIQSWMVAENRQKSGYQHDISVLHTHLADGTFALIRKAEQALASSPGQLENVLPLSNTRPYNRNSGACVMAN